MEEVEVVAADKFITFNNVVLPVVSTKHDDFWFVANVVAEAVGYKNPRQSAHNILNRNPEDFEGYRLRETIYDDGQQREVILLNEQGIYVFCMMATTKEAVKFRRAVSEKIKEWRRQTEVAVTKMPSSQLVMLEQQLALFQGFVSQMKSQEEAIQSVQAEVTDIKRGLIDINQPLREQLNDVIRRTAIVSNMEFRDVYHIVYDLIRVQKHVDVRRRAKNRSVKAGRKIPTIDIIEELGMLGYVVQLAKSVEADLNPNSPKWKDRQPTQ